MTEQKALPKPLIETIAGFVAGIASTLVAHPLDLVKTRLQGTLAANITSSSTALIVVFSRPDLIVPSW